MLCHHCDLYFRNDTEIDDHLQTEQVRVILEWVRERRKPKPAQGEGNEESTQEKSA